MILRKELEIEVHKNNSWVTVYLSNMFKKEKRRIDITDWLPESVLEELGKEFETHGGNFYGTKNEKSNQN